MLESNAASIAARLSTPDRPFLALIGKNYRAINFGWRNETKRVVAFCVAECVCNYGGSVWHLRNNKPSLWNHQKTMRSQRFFLVCRFKSSGRKTCKTALNRTQLHFRKERWPRWLNRREHDNTRGSLYLLVFVYLLYTFLLTDFPLLSCSKQCCQRWQPHKAQYTIHSCTPGSQVALEFDGGLFLCFFCRFQSFETLNRDFLAATHRRKQTKYVDHFIIYLKIVLILIWHSKKKIRALIWIKFTIKRKWKCRPQIWRERRSRHAWL